MSAYFSNFIDPSRFRRIRFSFFIPALACVMIPVAAQAQVTFTGAQPSVNIGSQAIGSASKVSSLSFTIGATKNTQVGSIAVLTTGIADKDFTQAEGGTCKAEAYTASTRCTVNVTFKPLFAGLRAGAVVFYSGTNRGGTVLATVPVYGIGTGPQAAFGLSNARSSIGSKLISPAGVAVDAAGNVFITDLDYQKVFKVTPSGAQTTVGSGFSVPEAVAVDGAGNAYVADSYAATVYKITPDGVQTTIGTGFSYPNGVAVDGAGNVYVTDPFTDDVYKITPTGTQTTVGSGYNTPAAVAVDAADNVYVADTYNQAVYKITPAGVQTVVGGTLESPAGVAVDAAGDVYITDDGTAMLYRIAPGGAQATLVTDLNEPNGVALDGPGNLYIGDTYSKKALKIDRANPQSLHFENTKKDSTSKDSPQMVDVENIGNAALKFSALTFPKNFPQGTSDNDCSTDNSLAPANTCSIGIDFSPLASLGTKNSLALSEDASVTTNNLNVAKTLDKIAVTGTEIAK